MTPADSLRARVVTLVLVGVLVLTAGLYSLVGLLLWGKGADAVPDALWLAAGTLAGALITWLNNSKGGVEGGTTAGQGPLEVVAPPGEPLAVREEHGPLHRQPVGDLGESAVLVVIAVAVVLIAAALLLPQL